jgi:LPXTG-motif cell wall-anchored protein
MSTDIAAVPQLLAELPHPANTWPWLALAGIALILAAIALVGRRRAPYGM